MTASFREGSCSSWTETEGGQMERIRRIYEHPLFRKQLSLTEEAERDRRFCGHSLDHLLDTARICMILSLEGYIAGRDPYPERDVVYAAGLLHDIGRYAEYSEGKDHGEAGAGIAERILSECGYSGEEIACITDAIRDHRGKAGHGDGLSGHLREADRLSRRCFECEAREDCYWDEERKNKGIEI